MPLPAMLAAAAPYAIPAISGLLGWLGGRSSGRSNMPQYMPQSFRGMNSMELPGGSTATQLGRFQPEQTNVLSQLLQGGISGLQNLPSASFEPIKQAAMSQFSQDIIPGIAERFSGLGAGGQRSSAFQQALGGAGAGLAERLAAMQQGFNMQQRQMDLGQLMSMLQMGLQPQFEYGITPPQSGFGTQLAGGLGQGAGMLAPLLAMKYLGL